MAEIAPPPRKHRRRWPIVMVAAVLAIVSGLVPLLIRGAPSRARFPDPNGYDDIVQAGGMIHPNWPNKGDLTKATPEERRAFVLENRPSLDRARLGLGRESLVRMEDTQEGLAVHLPELNKIRQLSRLFIGESMVLEADGKVAEAARVDLDLLRLAQAATQGGLLIDASQGWAVQGQAIARLRVRRDALTLDQCRTLIRDLEGIDARRITVDAIFARENQWLEGTYNPFQRTMMGWSGLTANAQKQVKAALENQRVRSERGCRFLMVELAIHAYHLEHNDWPKALEDLVPAYLSALPLDSSTGKPIDYPRSPSGEFTDDLSSIGLTGAEAVTPSKTAQP